MTNPTFTARVLASINNRVVDLNEIQSVEMSGRFADRAAAEAFIAAQPKMLRLSVRGIHNSQEATVYFLANFHARKDNDKNEAGIKRTARALKVLAPVDQEEGRSLNAATLADLARWMG